VNRVHGHTICHFVWLIIAVAAGLLLLCPLIGATSQQNVPEATKAPASAPSVPTPIPLTDVVTRATEVDDILQTIRQKSESPPEIEKIREMIPEFKANINRNFSDTMIIINQQPMLSVLQTQQHQWQELKFRNTRWLSIITRRSNDLGASVTELSELQKVWSITLKAAETSKAPHPVLQQIKETITAIHAAQKPLDAQLTIALDLATSVAEVVAKCDTVLARIDQAQKKAVGGIFVRSSVPITNIDLWIDLQTELPARIREVAAAYWKDIIRYFYDPYERMPLHAGILVVLMLLFLSARHQVRKWIEAGEAVSPDMKVFDRPAAAALAITLVAATSPNLPLPYTVRVLFKILSVVPIIILIRSVIGPTIISGVYILALLFLLETAREVFSGEPLILQVLLLIESLAGIAALVWYSRKLRHLLHEKAGPSRLRMLHAVSGLFILILSVGLVAAVTGYTRLALLLTPVIIVGGSLAVALYAVVRILRGMVDFAFRVWPLRTLRMVRHHREHIEKRIGYFLIVAAIIAWFARLLNNIGLLGQTLSFWESVFTAKLERGSISISLGDVLEFLFTVWVAYLLSAFLRFILREDVYPRLKISVGKSYAVSSLLHYIIITLGFLAAIGMLGVDLTKVTVLAGALGVGIGFGLQSIVNNFISGLILLVERPVHVGDTVEVGELLGQVRSIGIRASTVRTRQGADIIVPNSQLISEKVTNWTLSDQMRRIDLPVGVSYGAVPGDVIKVLEKVANENRHVLPDPPPQGLFIGFGDSSINFELRAWTDHFDNWPQIRSELAVAVFDAVRAAGMSFPFPQREVRLLHETDEGQKNANE
jgi:potassium-dependent mechanosensitive channel